LGLQIATAAATATPCLGRFDVRAPGPVLIYLAEDGLGTVRERLDALARARRRTLGHLDMRVITAPTLRLDRDDDMRRLAATVRDAQPRLLVLDPLVRLHGADENNATEIATILSRLRVLQRHYDVAVLVVHHTRKQGGGRQHGQTLRGSGDLHAWGDSNLYLTHERAGVTLTAEHRAAPAPDPVLVTLPGDPPRLVPQDV
jgi:RecA-family ATPase